MKQVIVCRCEEVSLEDIKQTALTHESSAREVKLRTRAGMGYCGGRTCRPMIDALLKQIMDKDPTNHIPLKVQPPIRPISLKVLGGQNIGK